MKLLVVTRNWRALFIIFLKTCFSEYLFYSRYRLYCTVEEPDLAINMYKKLRQVMFGNRW